jgi:anti-sigma factor RsiW
MQCADAAELVSASIDGELAGERLQAAAAHLASCADCTALADDYRRIGRQLSDGYEPAPPHLADKIAARLATEEAATRVAGSVDWRRRARQAAVLLMACALSALATWHLARLSSQNAGLERDVVAAHVRSLLQDSPVQVASSDRHTVKPWFAGRLDFSPPVKDLAAEGFELTGGRLDIVGDRRIAAVIYQRRQHVINVFIWPTAAGPGLESAGAMRASLKGYNVLSWTSEGLTYWAVSDLNAAELGELQKLL